MLVNEYVIPHHHQCGNLASARQSALAPGKHAFQADNALTSKPLQQDLTDSVDRRVERRAYTQQSCLSVHKNDTGVD